jgi:steroid delta-isomerase-like uncharacterized protein
MNCSSTETEEIIRLYYEAFNAGDRGGMLRLLTQDVAHGINQGDVVSGVAAFERFLEQMDVCYEEKVEDLVVMVNEKGDRAAAEFFIRGRYLSADAGLPPAEGQTYHLRVGAFFELTGGLITRVTNYYNMQDWLRQVGA